jgi:hypothetical protein
MVACGIWRARSRLVAVFVDDDGRATPAILSTIDDDERWALLEQVDAVHGLDCALIFSDALLKTDAICRFALDRGHHVWVAPWALIDAIRHVARLRTDARTAAMIARLALVPGLRSHLRRIDRAASDCRQLPLL